MSFKEFLDHLKAEGQVINKAPVAFFSFVVIASTVVFLGVDWHYAGTILEKDSTITQKDATIATVLAERDSIKGENERLARDNEQLKTYRGKDAPPLKQNAVILAQQIHDFIKDWKDTDSPDQIYPNVQKYIQRFGLR